MYHPDWHPRLSEIRVIRARFQLHSGEEFNGVITAAIDMATYLAMDNGCIQQLDPELIASIDCQPSHDNTRESISDEPIDHLNLRMCRHLKSLNLSRCSVSTVICESDELRSIIARNNDELTHLKCKNCAVLESMDLSGCRWLEYLNANWCEGLSTLNLAGCYELCTVKLRGTDLTELDLTGREFGRVDVRDCDQLRVVKVDSGQVSKVDHDDLEVVGV